jgi:hypothetical protein
MTSVSFMKGTPAQGSVNSSPPFSFGSASGVGADYGNRPSVAALQNPTMHNNVPEVMVNSTARAPLFVRPFHRGFEKEYSEGDLLFVRREDSRASSTHNIVANLPVMNHLLRTTKKNGTDELEYDSLDHILEHWNYFGILNNDMDTGSKWQRLLNVNVRGRTRVARLWQPDNNGILRRGDMVWLGIYERTVKKNAVFCGPKGMREPMKRGTTYFEVCATLDCCNNFKDAVYLIPIGVVSQVTLKKPTTVQIQKAHSVTETCKGLERIEVLMRI